MKVREKKIIWAESIKLLEGNEYGVGKLKIEGKHRNDVRKLIIEGKLKS